MKEIIAWLVCLAIGHNPVSNPAAVPGEPHYHLECKTVCSRCGADVI